MNQNVSRRQLISYGATGLGALFASAITEQMGAQAASGMKVAIVLPGVITDNGWNQLGYSSAADVSKKMGAEFSYIEKVAQADQAEALSGFARRGYTVVLAHGGQFDAAIAQVAPQFPKTFFLAVNGQVTGPNIAAVQTNGGQISYLVGVLAASMSKTNKMAYLTGIDFKSNKQHYRGFELGAKSVKPDADVKVSYTGDYNDIAKGKEAALALIETGVDVIFLSLDNSAPAVLTAAEEKGVNIVLNYSDLSKLAPKVFLTSTVQDIGLANKKVVELAGSQKAKGQIYLFGLETPDIVNLRPMTSVVPAAVQQKVEAVKKDLIAKKIELKDCKVNGDDGVCLK